MLLAAATDPRLRKIWLDRMPWRLDAALEGPLASFLFDAMVPGFLLLGDFQDLKQAMGGRPILWTDPTNWMNQPVFPGPDYHYRFVGETDTALIEEFFKHDH